MALMDAVRQSRNQRQETTTDVTDDTDAEEGGTRNGQLGTVRAELGNGVNASHFSPLPPKIFATRQEKERLFYGWNTARRSRNQRQETTTDFADDTYRKSQVKA